MNAEFALHPICKLAMAEARLCREQVTTGVDNVLNCSGDPTSNLLSLAAETSPYISPYLRMIAFFTTRMTCIIVDTLLRGVSRRGAVRDICELREAAKKAVRWA